MFGFFKRKPKAPEWDRSQLVPRIKNTGFLKALAQMGMPKDQLPITEPFVADLVVTYAFDIPSSFVMASPVHLADAGLVESELREVALANLKKQIPGIRVARAGDVSRAVIGENLDACVLLAPTFWNSMAKEMKGPLVAAVPNRDVVIFCDSTNASAMAQMRTICDEEYEQGGNHSLSKKFIAWTGEGWKEA